MHLQRARVDHGAPAGPRAHVFIGPLADSAEWERRLQIVRALPCFTWTGCERRRVVQILRRDLAHPQRFVKAWALDSLARLAVDDAALVPVVRQSLGVFAGSGMPSWAARAIERRLAARSTGAVYRGMRQIG